jgi:hypothetical protein
MPLKSEKRLLNSKLIFSEDEILSYCQLNVLCESLRLASEKKKSKINIRGDGLQNGYIPNT